MDWRGWIEANGPSRPKWTGMDWSGPNEQKCYINVTQQEWSKADQMNFYLLYIYIYIYI